MVEVARNLLREKYIKADIGLSGANVVAADTGSLFIIENEGNIRLCTSSAPGAYRGDRDGKAGAHFTGCLQGSRSDLALCQLHRAGLWLA